MRDVTKAHSAEALPLENLRLLDRAATHLPSQVPDGAMKYVRAHPAFAYGHGHTAVVFMSMRLPTQTQLTIVS